MITSIEQAFKELDKKSEEIPFDAIRYLYDYPTNSQITEKIKKTLCCAYKDCNKNLQSFDDLNYIPLWYAIVAENHLVDDFIDPVIGLFSTPNKDWEMLNEQGGYLVGALCEKFPEIAPQKFMDAIFNLIGKKSNSTYLFLFDALHYIDIDKEKNRLLEIASNTEFLFFDSFVGYLADINLKEAIPILQSVLKSHDLHKFIKIEVIEAINRLENKSKAKGKLNQPYVKWRGHWEEHYKSFEEIFV